MKKNFEKAEVKVIRFAVNDVIATSDHAVKVGLKTYVYDVITGMIVSTSVSLSDFEQLCVDSGQYKGGDYTKGEPNPNSILYGYMSQAKTNGCERSST